MKLTMSGGGAAVIAGDHVFGSRVDVYVGVLHWLSGGLDTARRRQVGSLDRNPGVRRFQARPGILRLGELRGLGATAWRARGLLKVISGAPPWRSMVAAGSTTSVLTSVIATLPGCLPIDR
ncbi:hypothetical protein ADL00_34715 [Streptomyces sp. AS58]|nr:hypothetical protein ADL00_34715 [Streptomyces sp. AS58]